MTRTLQSESVGEHGLALKILDAAAARAFASDFRRACPATIKPWQVVYCHRCEAFHLQDGEMFVASPA